MSRTFSRAPADGQQSNWIGDWPAVFNGSQPYEPGGNTGAAGEPSKFVIHATCGKEQITSRIYSEIYDYDDSEARDRAFYRYVAAPIGDRVSGLAKATSNLLYWDFDIVERAIYLPLPGTLYLMMPAPGSVILDYQALMMPDRSNDRRDIDDCVLLTKHVSQATVDGRRFIHVPGCYSYSIASASTAVDVTWQTYEAATGTYMPITTAPAVGGGAIPLTDLPWLGSSGGVLIDPGANDALVTFKIRIGG